MKLPTTFIEQVNEVIRTNPNHPQLLHFLNKHFRLSTSQIYRKIKKSTGLSPARHIRIIRLELAKELVLHSDLTLTEIAQQIGFQQLAYFSRCFSNHFGITASALRKGETPKSKLKRQ